MGDETMDVIMCVVNAGSTIANEAGGLLLFIYKRTSERLSAAALNVGCLAGVFSETGTTRASTSNELRRASEA
jgi:hypothetical protein